MNEQKNKKTKKNAWSKIVAAIVVLFVIMFLAVLFSADEILKSGIETAIKKQLDLDASVGNAHLGFLSGKITVGNLKIKNLPDYEYQNVLELNSINVTAAPASLFSETIEISEIQLADITVVIEQKGLTNNINEILKSMPKSDPSPPAPAEGTDEKKEKNVNVKILNIENINVKAKVLPLPGKSDTLSLNIESITLKDIGSDKKVSTAELAGKIFVAIIDAVRKQGTDILPESLMNSIDTLLKAKDIKAVLQSKETIIKTGQDIEKELESVTEGLKGLFDKKKD